jgi:hypothetical protein
MVMNQELETTWNKAVLAYLSALSMNLKEGGPGINDE